MFKNPLIRKPLSLQGMRTQTQTARRRVKWTSNKLLQPRLCCSRPARVLHGLRIRTAGGKDLQGHASDRSSNIERIDICMDFSFALVILTGTTGFESARRIQDIIYRLQKSFEGRSATKTRFKQLSPTSFISKESPWIRKVNWGSATRALGVQATNRQLCQVLFIIRTV